MFVFELHNEISISAQNSFLFSNNKIFFSIYMHVKTSILFKQSTVLMIFSFNGNLIADIVCFTYHVHIFVAALPYSIQFVHDEQSFEPLNALYQLHRNTLAPPLPGIFQSSLFSCYMENKTENKL